MIISEGDDKVNNIRKNFNIGKVAARQFFFAQKKPPNILKAFSISVRLINLQSQRLINFLREG